MSKTKAILDEKIICDEYLNSKIGITNINAFLLTIFLFFPNTYINNITEVTVKTNTDTPGFLFQNNIDCIIAKKQLIPIIIFILIPP